MIMKRMTKSYISILRENLSSLKYTIKKKKKKKINGTRNYLLDEINHNDFMSAKYKKTCKYSRVNFKS